jgi:hypothetical protein
VPAVEVLAPIIGQPTQVARIGAVLPADVIKCPRQPSPSEAVSQIDQDLLADCDTKLLDPT